MNMTTIIITFLIGLSFGFLLRYFLARLQAGSIEKKIKTLIEEAQEKRKEIIYNEIQMAV